MTQHKYPCTVGQTLSLNISDLNHRGEGVGKLAGFTLFVPATLPGETARVRVIKLHSNYGTAKLLALETESEDRITPLCPYFEDCGGCQLQHLSYEKQLLWKHSMLTETLLRIAGIRTLTLPLIGMDNPWQYRNKAHFHFSHQKGCFKAGFHSEKSNQVIDIDSCIVQHPLNNETLAAFRGALRKLYGSKEALSSQKALPTGAVVRSSFDSAECLATIIGPQGSIDIKFYKTLANQITTEAARPPAGIILLNNSSKRASPVTLQGKEHLEEKIGSFRYRISPLSFFQANPKQTKIVYEVAAKMAGRSKLALDLYCGTGSFSLYLSKIADRVIATETEKSAVEDARLNARRNKIDNVTFINTPSEKITSFLDQDLHPDTVFLNPPRRGCSSTTLEAVKALDPARIIYISCNPATLARDLKYLVSARYAVNKIQPVDMFPQTSHLEAVTLLERKA
jgi:23S rRNA (uracil1939-C5)-methyltransferase